MAYQVYKDNREFIIALEANNDLVTIQQEVDWDLVMGAIVRRVCERKLPSPYFKKIRDYPGFEALGAALATYKILAIAMGMNPSASVLEISNEYVRRTTPWISDGGPHSWFAPDGRKGDSYVNVLNPGAAMNQAEYYYPMNQSARMLWYHDHAWGTTRLNAYAGIASALLLRDGFENDLKNQGLPEYIEFGGRELPIVVQDKVFVGTNTQRSTRPGPDHPPGAASGTHTSTTPQSSARCCQGLAGA